MEYTITGRQSDVKIKRLVQDFLCLKKPKRGNDTKLAIESKGGVLAR